MLCGGVEACHRYGVCTVWCVECDSCSYMFRSTTIIREPSLQPRQVIYRLRFGKILRRYMLWVGVAACHRYGRCTVRCVECDRVALNTANSFFTESQPKYNFS